MIKPAWSHLKRTTTKQGTPKTKAEAITVWKKAWRDLEQWRIQAWIERIMRHIQIVIDLKGNNNYKVRKARRKNQDGSNHRHLRKKINGAGLMIILASAKQRVIRRTFRILSVSLSFYTIDVIQYQCFGKSPVFSAYAHSFRVYLHILRNFVCGLTLVPKWTSTGPMKDFLKAPP
jgi:hypothetical protein